MKYNIDSNWVLVIITAIYVVATIAIWLTNKKSAKTSSGNSQDIDIFSPKKFEVLKKYLDKHNLKGGFVKNDGRSDELCICTENFTDDITSEDWKLLTEIFE